MECKRCDNGSHGWYVFFALAKNPYHQIMWVIWLFCLSEQKPVSPHMEHSTVLSLTAHMISNRQTCQKEKCMINRLWYGNFHIIPHINPRPICGDMGFLPWQKSCITHVTWWYGFSARAKKAVSPTQLIITPFALHKSDMCLKATLVSHMQNNHMF